MSKTLSKEQVPKKGGWVTFTPTYTHTPKLRWWQFIRKWKHKRATYVTAEYKQVGKTVHFKLKFVDPKQQRSALRKKIEDM